MQKLNRTGIFVLINSLFIGAQGFAHGVSEMLKGNTPTGGIELASIGAFTFIQNYLYTGIVSSLTGILIILSALLLIKSRFYSLVFTLLCITLAVTGGGVAFILFYLFTIYASLQKETPFGFTRAGLNGKAGDWLAKNWKFLVISSYSCIAAGVAVWLILIPPGITREISVKQYTCWGFLLLGIIGLFPSVAAGIAGDLRDKG